MDVDVLHFMTKTSLEQFTGDVYSSSGSSKCSNIGSTAV